MQKSVWVVLVIVMLLASACGPAMQPAAGPATETGEVFVIALPRIIIDFDEMGTPSIAGLKLSELRRFGVSAGDYRLSKFYIDWMMSANVQHVEMRQTGNGVVLLVNGKALPHIGWSDASLQKMGDFAGMFNVQNTQMISKFLPIVRRLGLDIVLRFPRQPGSAEIALMDPEEAIKVAAAKPEVPASAVVQFEVKYDAKGVPAILGITASDLAAMGLNAPLALSPSALQMLQTNNIQTIELRGKSDGLFVYINGEPLPNIVWDDTFLTNAADLYVQMNPGAPKEYLELARTTLPLVSRADVAVMVHFPLAANAQPIAAKMHIP